MLYFASFRDFSENLAFIAFPPRFHLLILQLLAVNDRFFDDWCFAFDGLCLFVFDDWRFVSKPKLK